LACTVFQVEKKSPMNLALAAELRAERGAKQMTVKQLSEAAGIPTATLNRVLAGERDINITQIGHLARALSIDPAVLTRRAVLRMGGMEVLEAEAEERATRNGVAMSEATATNVTRLHNRNDQLTAEQIDAGTEDKAASEITPESALDEDGDS
jgi:transcriptional regulator with XRE-family HTH domain